MPLTNVTGHLVLLRTVVSIGNGAVIGAGSLVNCNIPSMTFTVGSPVRLVKALSANEDGEKPINLIKTLEESIEFTNSLPMQQWDGTDAAFRAAQAAQLVQSSNRPGETLQHLQEEQRERLRKSEIIVMAAVAAVVLVLVILFGVFFTGWYIGGKSGCIDL